MTEWLDGDDGLSVRAVCEFFGRAMWPMYQTEDVTIDAFPFASGMGSLKGFVGFDTGLGRWHVVVHSGASPQKVFFWLAHELGHVVSGHVNREGGQVVVDHIDAVRGDEAALKKVHEHHDRDVVESDYDRSEAEANAFAEKLTSGWFPTLVGWRDPDMASRVAWSVHEAIERMNTGGSDNGTKDSGGEVQVRVTASSGEDTRS